MSSTVVQYNGEGDGTPLQYSCLENPMDGGAWWAAVHGVARSRTRVGDFTFTFHFHALEKKMATHSSVLAWRIPGTGEPDGLPSMGSHRVGHDWSDLAAAYISLWVIHVEVWQKTIKFCKAIILQFKNKLIKIKKEAVESTAWLRGAFALWTGRGGDPLGPGDTRHN